uniref:Pheromone-regulated membrane protein 10 n=1 Tax=Zeugodacus cucurbitae TaxID=28588 RepID=A0A0A1X131_ZEUCU
MHNSNSNRNDEICHTETSKDAEVEVSESANNKIRTEEETSLQQEPAAIESKDCAESTESITEINNSTAEQVDCNDLTTVKPQAIELKIITKTFIPVAETNNK